MTHQELAQEIEFIKSILLSLRDRVEALEQPAPGPISDDEFDAMCLSSAVHDFWNGYPNTQQTEDYFGKDFRIRD